MGVLSPNDWASAFDTSAEEAANRQISAIEDANRLAREQFDYQKEIAKPFYEEGLPAFREMTSAITGKPSPTTGKVWTPETTPAFQWQQAEQEKALGRSLRALGRESSTFGETARTQATQSLLASEYDKQLGRLADLTNIARGGASSLAGASTGYTQNVMGGLGQIGQVGAQSALAQSLMGRGNLYGGIQGAAQTGKGIWDFGKGQGWWGADTAGSATGSGLSSAVSGLGGAEGATAADTGGWFSWW